jgi:hypothetical protein
MEKDVVCGMQIDPANQARGLRAEGRGCAAMATLGSNNALLLRSRTFTASAAASARKGGLAAAATGTLSHQALISLGRQHLAALDMKLERLTRFRSQLHKAVESWTEGGCGSQADLPDQSDGERD